METKTQFIRFFSHELRTPLNVASLGVQHAIDKFSDMLQQFEDILSEDWKDIMEEISTAIDSTLLVVNDLLLYDKLETGMTKLDKKKCNIVNFINESTDMFAAEIRSKDIKLELKVGADLATSESASHVPTFSESQLNKNRKYSIQITDSIYVDKNKFGLAIKNLMSNAIKVTNNGGTIRITARFAPNTRDPSSALLINFGSLLSNIRICCISTLNYIRIPNNSISTDAFFEDNMTEVIDGKFYLSISDNGLGLCAEDQQNLFRDVIQFNPKLLQTGSDSSGLGLCIANIVVELHGGNVSVFSEGEGKGSTFTVELPMTLRRLRSRNNTSESKSKKVFSTKREASLEMFSLRKHEPLEGSSDNLSLDKYYNELSLTDTHGSILSVSPLNSGRVKAHVLLVDDSGPTRKMVGRVLKKEGYSFDEAVDGSQAVQMIKHSLMALANWTHVIDNSGSALHDFNSTDLNILSGNAVYSAVDSDAVDNSHHDDKGNTVVAADRVTYDAIIMDFVVSCLMI